MAAGTGVLDAALAAFGDAQQWLFEAVVQPLLFASGLGNLVEDGYRATGWLLVGLLQLLVMLTVFAALERWRPVEPRDDPAAVRTDVVYTLLHRLGVVRVALFFTVDPLWDALVTRLRMAGVPQFQLDVLLPGLAGSAFLAFLVYLVLFDFVDYWLHRGQHAWRWWWALHAVHHSQRRMTMWSDNRNHFLDDMLRDAAFVGVALAVGAPPGQFVAVVAVTQLLESLSHANVRLGFGPVLGRLLVSPHYHRVHHAIGTGHESNGPGSLGGVNFAVLFPVWDTLFGTARHGAPLEPTGIRDQLPGADGRPGRDYGRGLLAQQWLALRRMAGWREDAGQGGRLSSRT